jgi:hypothetical protein
MQLPARAPLPPVSTDSRRAFDREAFVSSLPVCSREGGGGVRVELKECGKKKRVCFGLLKRLRRGVLLWQVTPKRY